MGGDRQPGGAHRGRAATRGELDVLPDHAEHPFDIEGFDSGDVALATGTFFVANALALTVGPALSGVAAEWIEMRTVLLIAALMPLAWVAGALLLADPRRPSRPTDVSDVEPAALAPAS
jgi:hypothetical protein